MAHEKVGEIVEVRDPNALRQQIWDARLRVNLDQKRHRETSSKVKQLAAMELPPLVVTSRHRQYSRKPRLG